MRWVAGFLLVGAAVLKAIEPATALLSPLGRYFLPAQVGIELALGLLLLSGLYWRVLRWLAIVLFAGFAGYSLHLAWNGAASCGCFGPLRVNPWWTFGLDSAVVLGLLISAMFGRSSNGHEVESADAWLATKIPSRQHAVAIVMSVAVISMALLFRYASQQTAKANGLITTTGNLVILEPERWMGQKLPIAESIDLDLSNGEWTVLLHRHDCPACQDEVPRYEQRAERGERIMLVEVPPYGDFERRDKACRYGRLKDDREWFVQTPVELRLNNSIVTAVKTHDH